MRLFSFRFFPFIASRFLSRGPDGREWAICLNDGTVTCAHWDETVRARSARIPLFARATRRDCNRRRSPAAVSQSCVCEIGPCGSTWRVSTWRRGHAGVYFQRVSISARRAKARGRAFKKKKERRKNCAAITLAPVTSTANYRIIGERTHPQNDSLSPARPLERKVESAGLCERESRAEL